MILKHEYDFSLRLPSGNKSQRVICLVCGITVCRGSVAIHSESYKHSNNRESKRA